MNTPRFTATLAVVCAFAVVLSGQTPNPQAPPAGAGGGAFPPPPQDLVARFDKDGDTLLNSAERKAAQTYVVSLPRRVPLKGATPAPGPRLTPGEVKAYTSESLYDPSVLRTFFLEFEDADWEEQMADFNNTDIDIPVKMTVDGKTYSDVGIHFRGASSFGSVPAGWKRSINIAMDLKRKNQNLLGYKTLNLLNAHNDPTFLRSALYQYIVRQYVPAPKVNFVRLVINGESWGIYANSMQFNAESVKEYFGETKGNRWKVQGSPSGRGGLNYLGADPALYKTIYRIRTKDDPKAWADLINLCKVLTETPLDRLEAAVAPILDLDSTLKWLALDKGLMNSDGYWMRMSDYNIYQNEKGKFFIVSHDANETLREPEGTPRNLPPGGAPIGPETGAALDPFAGDADPAKVLMNRLLKVPALRAKYLAYLRDIAETWLDWNKVGPVAQQWHSLIAADVRADTRKLYSTEAFNRTVTEAFADAAPPSGVGGPGVPQLSLKSFFDQRRAYLLAHPDVKGAPRF